MAGSILPDQRSLSEITMRSDIITCFLELGHAASLNLEYSHCHKKAVSYGEETITETNMLEIHRRLSKRVRVKMFSKPQEGKIGADWEWRIIGRQRTARMRVQAKRLQCNDVLKITHVVKSSGKEQRNILIAGAGKEFKPVYCFYCTERQRDVWARPSSQTKSEGFQYGCLLADAHDVPLETKCLKEIEKSASHGIFSLIVPITSETRANG